MTTVKVRQSSSKWNQNQRHNYAAFNQCRLDIFHRKRQCNFLWRKGGRHFYINWQRFFSVLASRLRPIVTLGVSALGRRLTMTITAFDH
jgi:hypothetical protein